MIYSMFVLPYLLIQTQVKVSAFYSIFCYCLHLSWCPAKVTNLLVRPSQTLINLQQHFAQSDQSLQWVAKG